MQDSLGRPDFDLYFIAMSLLISQRSLDPSTKHGAVFVADDNSVLSIGYNGPLRGCDDSKIPLNRENKYPYFVHAEENGIINAARKGVSLLNSTLYVSGEPCEKCLRMIIGVGVKKIIYGPIKSSCVNEESQKIIKNLLLNQNIEIKIIDDKNKILDFYKNLTDYIGRKI